MLLTPRLFVLEKDPAASDKVRDVTLAEAGLRLPLPGVCIVPRAECSYRRVRLAGIGRQAQQAALLRAKQESLPGENGTLIIPDNIGPSSSGFMASSWSFARSSSHNGRYLPESLAQTGLEDGARIVKGLSGFEGQIWADGNLAASRWWPSDPTTVNWNVFLQASQETLGALNYDLPLAEAVPWRKDLSVLKVEREQLSQWFSPVNLGAFVATFLACGYSYIGAQYLRESLVLRHANAKVQNLSDDTAQILSFRRRALANQTYIEGYRALGGRSDLIDAFGSFASILGATDLSIERFDLRDAEIQMRLRGDDEISVPDVVSLLEADPSLSGVSVSLDSRGNVVVLAMLEALEVEN